MTEEKWPYGSPVQVEVEGQWRDGQVEAVSRFQGHIVVRLADDKGFITRAADRVRRR